MRAGTWWPVAAVMALGACVGDGASSSVVPSGATSADVPATATPPEPPPRCAAADLAIWTAQVVVDETAGTATPVLRLRNDGTVRCEADISGSANRSDEVEPNVWLDPGAWADLVLAEATAVCGSDLGATLSVDVVINGAAVDVPTTAVTRCGLVLAAFFPNETATTPCRSSDLEVAPWDRVSRVLLTNKGGSSCRVGRGAFARSSPEAGVEVVDLAPGDVAGWRGADDQTCAHGFASHLEAETVVTDDLHTCAVLHGAGRPYFGDPLSRFAESLARGEAPEVALTYVDPFRPGRPQRT